MTAHSRRGWGYVSGYVDPSIPRKPMPNGQHPAPRSFTPPPAVTYPDGRVRGPRAWVVLSVLSALIIWGAIIMVALT